MPMQRIVKPADRDDLIAFLKRATNGRGGQSMKAMPIAFLAIAAIAVGAEIALDFIGFSTREITSGPAVRSG